MRVCVCVFCITLYIALLTIPLSPFGPRGIVIISICPSIHPVNTISHQSVGREHRDVYTWPGGSVKSYKNSI